MIEKFLPFSKRTQSNKIFRKSVYSIGSSLPSGVVVVVAVVIVAAAGA